MDADTLLKFMNLAEKLKCNTRHSFTSSGRRESVAEHTYRLMVFAWLVKEEFPDYDASRVLELCLFHDLGEAVTGDIPSFEKKEEDKRVEEQALTQIAQMLPSPQREELRGIFKEVLEKKTEESRLVQALDKMEAVIQHNEADISTWLPLEYKLQLTYGQEQAEGLSYMQLLRARVRKDTLDKIEREGNENSEKQTGYSVSSSPERISLKRVCELMKQTHWAKERTKEEIKKAMEHSKAYGVFDAQDYMAGYARVVTDFTTTFYLCDVIIDEAYRGRGLGRLLLDKIMEDMGHLHGILHTDTAAGLYETYGFEAKTSDEDILMEKRRTAPSGA